MNPKKESRKCMLVGRAASSVVERLLKILIVV